MMELMTNVTGLIFFLLLKGLFLWSLFVLVMAIWFAARRYLRGDHNPKLVPAHLDALKTLFFHNAFSIDPEISARSIRQRNIVVRVLWATLVSGALWAALILSQ